jgi:CubicO group peptidase (beta-lactamase class C family)
VTVVLLAVPGLAQEPDLVVAAPSRGVQVRRRCVDAVDLLASISKPVNAVALMRLVERGQVSLDDPVAMYLPEFAGAERAAVRVRDLLTHTSGLPDMLPNNIALRRAHAPLSAFVQGACTTLLQYPPRTGFDYQSMGTLLAGEIVQRVSGQALRLFHQREIFDVLGMHQSSLGLGGRSIADTVWCEYDSSPDVDLFGANTPYWRDMGHPWGGMHTTVTDLSLLLQAFLNGGQLRGQTLLRRQAIQLALQNSLLHVIGSCALARTRPHSFVNNTTTCVQLPCVCVRAFV